MYRKKIEFSILILENRIYKTFMRQINPFCMNFTMFHTEKSILFHLFLTKLSDFKYMRVTYRVHPIPLESGMRSECTLTEYVVRLEAVLLNNSTNQEKTTFHAQKQFWKLLVLLFQLQGDKFPYNFEKRRTQIRSQKTSDNDILVTWRNFYTSNFSDTLNDFCISRVHLQTSPSERSMQTLPEPAQAYTI